MVKSNRLVEVYIPAVGWVNYTLNEVKEKDVFRMYESTGAPVINGDGHSIYVAEENARLDNGVWVVNIGYLIH